VVVAHFLREWAKVAASFSTLILKFSTAPNPSPATLKMGFLLSARYVTAVYNPRRTA